MSTVWMQDGLWVVLAPLVGAMVAGLGCRVIPRVLAHTVTILGVALSFAFSCKIFWALAHGAAPLNKTLYIWGTTGAISLQVGFLIDQLTALMMLVVTFVSLMVHIYTIGYMREDAGYNRFFAYISLFTFAMLMLVMSNNFLQLFFGWEAVGLVSYLLIGFWFKKPTAVYANLKAFLVNRVGDFGFLLGIGAVLWLFGSLNYADVFAHAPVMAARAPEILLPWGDSLSAMTLTCLLLFVGAMGKSAQVPLHVWLPDSMEGPTPISALIHAATMVTAGVFMVARMSPLFEYSEAALSFVMAIGAITCFAMGLLGIVQHDIKRVVAYSTLSQLGYMVTALGASAYTAGVYHLMTHAFFKALLFLGAGSVIIALHHEQDMRKMGGLWKKMPVTYATMLIGSLALIGFPGFAGFYSKDLIIEAVSLSSLPVAHWAYWCVLGSVFVTAFYSFRLFFLVFHTKPRMSEEHYSHVHETPMVVWGPLVALAVPSVFIGGLALMPLLGGFLSGPITVLPAHDVWATLAHHIHGPWQMAKDGFMHLPFVLAMAGVLSAFVCYVLCPGIPAIVARVFAPVHRLLEAKYGFDAFNETVFAGGARMLGSMIWRVGDVLLIDGAAVNGSARSIGRLAQGLRTLQSGYVYHYIFAMVLGVLAILMWFTFA